jgi:hypothetical protein
LIPKSPPRSPHLKPGLLGILISCSTLIVACSSERSLRVALSEADAGTAPASCRECEQASCPTLLTACEDAEGEAAAGPAAGQPKRDLCAAVIACVRVSGCASSAVEDCYCGPGVDPLACLTGGAAGVCKGAFEAAAESTDGFEVAERFVDPQFAVGSAVTLLGCDRDLCSSACSASEVPAPDAGPPGPECGTTADAGAPVEDAAPAMDSEGPADASPPPSCRDCEQASCPATLTACDEAAGVAEAGPAAGQPRNVLCVSAAECARTTRCAVSAVEDCFCGAGVDPLACLTGGASGPCRAEFEAAAESTDAFVVAERFVDPQFALGNAVSLSTCDRDSCQAVCFQSP